VSAHNTSLASLGLAALVLSAITWRACARTSPSPVGAVLPRGPEPMIAASSSLARTGAAGLDAGAAPVACRELAAALGAATCASRDVDAGEAEARTADLAHLVSVDPGRALAWIAEADQREGRQVEPRAALEVRALVALERIGSAHAKLQHFAERYPHSPDLPALVRLTGYHPRPPLQKPTR
jgi:hypothetical protein